MRCAPLDQHDVVATSVITEVEFTRAVARVREGRTTTLDQGAVSSIIAGLVLVDLTPAIRQSAATLSPAPVRSLDAIHLATAAALRRELVGVLTYDKRMQDAGALLSLPILAPN
jgi:predicted nucleic acid-binding protein